MVCAGSSTTDEEEEASHNQKADMAQRRPGDLAGEALRTAGFPARGTREPGRYAIDTMYALPPAGMIHHAARDAQVREAAP